jgi:hypothetical protein
MIVMKRLHLKLRLKHEDDCDNNKLMLANWFNELTNDHLSE